MGEVVLLDSFTCSSRILPSQPSISGLRPLRSSRHSLAPRLARWFCHEVGDVGWAVGGEALWTSLDRLRNDLV
jgi:hypothetical protein